MRFTPTAHFGIDNFPTEPCLKASGDYCTSGSFYAGPVLWEWFDFTGSDAYFKNDVSQSQFRVSEGTTKRAVVLTVGGGGGGAVDDSDPPPGVLGGGGGGAGGVGLHIGVELTGSLYDIQIGGGGEGITGSLIEPGNQNGNDGANSFFSFGGVNRLESAGGEGGIGDSNPKNGGRSGENYGVSYTNGNTSGPGWGGGGARTQTTSSIDFGFGFNFEYGWYGSGSNGAYDKSIRVGGGGGGRNTVITPIDSFGAGGYSETYPPGNGTDATGGGGGAGVAFKSTAPLEDTWWSSHGGNGRVIVFVPTNLCSGSLYRKTTGIERRGLTQWIEPGNARTFGKNFNGIVLEDIVTPKTNMFVTSNISPADSGSFNNLRYSNTQYTSSLGIVDTNFSSSLIPWSGVGTIEHGVVINSETPNYNLANDFSLEWIGFQGSSQGDDQIFGIITGSFDPDAAVSPFAPRTLANFNASGAETEITIFKEFEPVNSTSSLAVNVTDGDDTTQQYVLTYTSSSRTLELYRTGSSIATMGNVEFPSQYDNQWAPFLEVGPYPHKSLRVYNKAISTDTMLKNYSASLEL